MQPKSNRFAVLAALVPVVLLAGGCRRLLPPTAPQTSPFAGRTVRVACPDETTAELIDRHGANGWGQRQNAQVKVLRYAAGAEPPEADAWVIRPAELGRWASVGRLQPVPDTLLQDEAFGWGRLLPVYRDPLLCWGRTPYALPLVGDSPLCFYRADLLAPAESGGAAKKLPPATWEDLAELAEAFAGRRTDLAPLPPLPASPDDFDRLFYSIAASYARQAISRERQADRAAEAKLSDEETLSLHYDLETGRCRIDTAGFVEAVKLLQRLQRLRGPGTHPAPPELFGQGKAAFCLADATWVHRFQEGPVRDKFSICHVPGTRCYFSYQEGERREVPGGNWVPYLGTGGWLMVVPAKSADPEAAFALLADLSGTDTSRQIVYQPKWGGGAFRNEHLDNLASWSSFGLGATQSQLVESLNRTLRPLGLKNPAFRLRTPDQAEKLQALLEVVQPALLEGKDAEATMKEVARHWQQLDEKVDPKTRLADYRLNLGLTPKR
jgi:ABC-type glycerol-3-phosphate transport system substrate-binding protein